MPRSWYKPQTVNNSKRNNTTNNNNNNTNDNNTNDISYKKKRNRFNTTASGSNDIINKLKPQRTKLADKLREARFGIKHAWHPWHKIKYQKQWMDAFGQHLDINGWEGWYEVKTTDFVKSGG